MLPKSYLKQYPRLTIAMKVIPMLMKQPISFKPDKHGLYATIHISKTVDERIIRSETTQM